MKTFTFFPLLDHALVGQVMSTDIVLDGFECHLKCIGNNICKSFNVRLDGSNAGQRICELNNKTRQVKPGDFKWKKGSTYFGSLQASCIDVSRKLNDQTVKSGQCHPGYKGGKCEKLMKGWYFHYPGHSCKDIRDSGDSKEDGEYWIDPEKNGNPLKVFWDMTTDGGDWLLVSKYVIDSSSSASKLSVETSYRGVGSYHNNKTFLTKSAMNELWTHLYFTQLRFYCSTQQGRTFHVTTVANSTGEAVVQYFSGQTDDRPVACGSFFRMENDNSRLAGACYKWENGKWGWGSGEDSLYLRAAYIPNGSKWVLSDKYGNKCDTGVRW